MKNKKTIAPILFIILTAVSIMGTSQQAGAHTVEYCETKAEIKQLEDELENLDKQLQVYIAAPREVDLDDEINIIAAGVRLGKAVLVEPNKVEISLEDRDGFRMGVRKWRPGESDTDQSLYVVEPYTKLFWTEFPAIQTAGTYIIRVDMTYTAPWGEEISGTATQEISCQSWFNISSILEQQKQNTQKTLNTVLGNASQIVKDVAANVEKVAEGIGDVIDFVDKMQQVGTIDPAIIRFFIPYINGYRSDSDMGSRQSVNGTELDPAANYQAFVDSLDVLVDAGLPFEAYIIETQDQLNAYHEAYNSTWGADPVETYNPDPQTPGSYYLDYDPDQANNWVSGHGNTVDHSNQWDLTDPLPYRNVLVNLYEDWFPIADEWNDYTTTYDRDVEDNVAYGDAEWTERRWVKAISTGLDRNYSLFYNVKGEPMRNFFNIGTGNDITGADGFDMMNDFCLFTFNFTADISAVDPNVQEDLGGQLDTETVRESANRTRCSPDGPLTVIGDKAYSTLDWIGTGLFNKIYPDEALINDEGFVIQNRFLDLAEYGNNGYYAAGVGMLLSPGLGFGYTSLENTTMGFELLHGMYYKNVGDAVQLGLERLLSGAEKIQEEKPQIASEMMTLYNDLHDAWHGTPDSGLVMDLEEVNNVFMEINELTMPTINKNTGDPQLGRWMNESLDYMDNRMTYMQNVTKTAFNESVELDEALAQAGSDINFGFFGDLFGSIGGFFGNVGGGILNGLGWIGSGLGWLGSFTPLADIPGYPEREEWEDNMGENANNMEEHTDKAIDEGLKIYNLIKDKVISLIKSLVKGMLSKIVGSITGNFDLVNDLIDQINTFKDQVAEAIKDVLGLIQDLVQAMAQALNNIADTITDIKNFLNDFVELSFDFIINQTNSIQQTMKNIKTDVLQSTGFYYQIKDSMFKMVEKSEIASGLLRYAAKQASEITDEIFFKELDVLQPMAMLQSGDSGLYVVQLGNEAVDDIIFVTIYKGQLVNVDDINATYQMQATSPIKMQVEQAYSSEGGLATGVYIADFHLATERDWMTKCDVKFYDDDLGKDLNAFIVERTSKIEPTLQPDAYPEIVFDPEAVQLRTGENYILHVGIDNLMYSRPNVTVRTELIGALGILVGLREERLQMNEEGEDPVFVDLEANIPFYVPSGRYQLIVKVVEDNGDVTRIVYDVNVTAENFIFGLIGGILAMLGIGIILQRRRATKKRGGGITVARTGRLLQGCSVKDAKAGKCTMVQCDELGNCSI